MSAGDLRCTVSATDTFTPALTTTSTSASVQIQGTFANCTSPNGRFSSLQSATLQGTGTATSSGTDNCALLIKVTATLTITWNTGSTSTASAAFNTDPGTGNPTIAFTITNGPLAGDSATVVAALTVNTDCATNGTKTLSSPAAAFAFS